MEFQVDLDSARNINCPKYLIAAHQSLARIGVPNKANKIATFDILSVRKYLSKLVDKGIRKMMLSQTFLKKIV